MAFARDVAIQHKQQPLAPDGAVQDATVRDGWPIDMQRGEILQQHQCPIEQRTRPSNPHADHSDDHVGSRLMAIA